MTTPLLAMEHHPLIHVDEMYATGRHCAVCGELTLSVVHVENLPDYVKCSSCGSAFILSEAADWAMFGSVSADYPETKQMVLKRWTTLEAVEAMAGSERLSERSSEEAASNSDPTPPVGIVGDGAGMPTAEQAATPPFGIKGPPADAAQATTPPFGIGELDEFAMESSNGNSDPLIIAAESLEDSADVSEPEPGRRYIVTLAQKGVDFPPERCAHCLRQPAPRKLLVAMGQESEADYKIPLCQSCYDRASARSEEQKAAKLVAHLSSVLIAGALIVGVLAAGLVNVENLGASDLLLIAAFALVGYGVPAVLLLRRASQLPPSEDAQFVRSTLRIRNDNGLGFGWRNRGYAELFSTVNKDLLLGDLTQISGEQS